MQAVVGALRAVLGLDSVAFEKGVAKSKQELGGLEKNFNAFEKNVGAVAGKMSSALASIGVALSIGGLVAFRKSLGETVGGLGELAEQLGVSTDALQAYQYIAGQSGVKTEQFEAAFIKFNKTLGDAAAGEKAAVEFFNQLGINIYAAGKVLRPNVDVFAETARKLDAMASGAEKTAKANDGMGRGGARLIPMFAELSRGIDLNIQAAKEAGQVVGEDIIKQFDKAADDAARIRKRVQTLAVGVIAPIEKSFWDQADKELTAVAKTLKDVETQIGRTLTAWERFQLALATARVAGGGILGDPNIENARKELERIQREIKNDAAGEQVGKVIGSIFGGETSRDAVRAEGERKKLTAQIEKLEEEAAFYRNLNASGVNEQQRLNNLEKIRQIEAEIAALQGAQPPRTPQRPPMPDLSGAIAATGTVDTREPALTHIEAWQRRGTIPARANPTGGQSPEERARQNLAAWRQEMQDYAAALQTLRKDSSAPLEDVEKDLESQRRLIERIRQGVKGLPEGSPLAKQITEQATATENARKSFDDYMRAAKDADAAEKQFGDGSVQLAKTQRELAEAMTTGRLSVEAQKIALDEATRSAEFQRLKMIGLTDQGWGGFVAGIQTAKLEWERANNAFADGQRFFESTMSHMTDALLQFVETGKISFRSLASSIIADIIRMQVKAAATGLFGLLGSALGSLLGFASPSASFAGTVGRGAVVGATPRAAGGPVVPGMPYWVGEKGPELIVPQRAGRVIPNDELGGMGGGGVTFNISVTGGDEAGTYRALHRIMPELKTQIADYILDRRLRGGKFGQGFRT